MKYRNRGGTKLGAQRAIKCQQVSTKFRCCFGTRVNCNPAVKMPGPNIAEPFLHHCHRRRSSFRLVPPNLLLWTGLIFKCWDYLDLWKGLLRRNIRASWLEQEVLGTATGSINSSLVLFRSSDKLYFLLPRFAPACGDIKDPEKTKHNSFITIYPRHPSEKRQVWCVFITKHLFTLSHNF